MQLVINTFGASLRRNGELFEIHLKEKKIPVAAKKLSSILITTGAHFSSDVIELALEHNIDIVMLNKFGHPFGRFWPAKMGSTTAIRRAQIKAAGNESGLEIIRQWTGTKLQNQLDLLSELSRRRSGQEELFDSACEQLSLYLQNLDKLTGCVDEIRHTILGIEGKAAAAYWRVIGQLPPEEFRFTTRSKRPAADPYNAMLNYAYGVLYSKVERACIIAGLDPFVGILHTDNYNKKSLVFDLIEPFRIWADRIVTKLFTGRRCKQDMFHTGKDGIILEKEAKDLLLGSLNEYLDQSIDYKIKSSKSKKTRRIKRLDCIQAEAHTFANRLLGKDGGLPEVMTTRDVFGDESC